ncbi:MAG TPA: glycosyltransferase [Egicoccus sp.]|nr:glycosyltransferase [Egicoccus sp.]HSK21707.1 glycosyltransferase [Egicoccus sp.]
MDAASGSAAVAGGSRTSGSVGGDRRIALFLPSLTVGGAETNLVRLSGVLGDHGFVPRLIVASGSGPLREHVPRGVEVVDLGVDRARDAVLPLASYLRVHRPDGLVSSVEHGSVVALAARALSRAPTRVVVRVATSLAADRGLGMTGHLARRAYPHAAGLIVNTAGGRSELARFLDLPVERIAVLPNLTVPEPRADDRVPAPHPWLGPGGAPVIVSVARLDEVKNPRLLLLAFAALLERRAARLLFLGDGPLRTELLGIANRLGVAAHVDLVGTVTDPRPYVQRARVFCLSSDAEAMPNAMIEAMAAGVGVVATNCGHGPRELLADGAHGRLVPRRDVQAMTRALDAALDDPRPAPASAWSSHTIVNAGRAYAHYLAAVLATR